MRFASALLSGTARVRIWAGRVLSASDATKRSALVVAALAATSALAGCGLDIAEERYASMKPMLVRQTAPKCDYRAAHPDKAAQPATADPDQQKAKLDYERQCYRHAEIIARNRLRELQKAVKDNASAVKAAETAEPSPPP